MSGDKLPFFGLDPKTTFFNTDGIDDTVKPFIIPIVGLIVGAAMMQIQQVATVGKLVLYFGAQSFMNIYMGWVMRTNVTVPKGTYIERTNTTLSQDLTGCPAGFALTAFQQVISFIVFMIFFAAVYYTPYKYTPKPLNTRFEILCVIIFGCVFALNIALNNFSLGYINIGVNLIIRSCLPLSTDVSQRVLANFGLYPSKPCKLLELALMIIGVLCAGIFTAAKIMSEGKTSKEQSGMVLGVLACIASLFCGSLNLALAGVLGETKLNVYDTVAYMAIPATLFLAPIALFISKPVPVSWFVVLGQEKMTDFEILMATWYLNKKTICWLLLSGVFSFAYNIIQFSIVHTLSPSATAFGGNFNKAALVFLTLILPCLRVNKLPEAPYIYFIWGAVICNIASFTAYSYLQIKAKQEAQANAKKRELMEDPESETSSEDDDDDDDDDSESSDGQKLC